MSYFDETFGQTFKVLRNYIPKEEALRLGKKYKDLVSTDGIPTIANVTSNAYDHYNWKDSVALLSEKVSSLNKLLGRKLLPTYTYTRMSENGASLDKHVDRPSCEISLSIHLYGDEEWAFCIKDADGRDRRLMLQPGDAVLYDAHRAVHWRDTYRGEFYISTFHHYVLLDGDYDNNFFDNLDEVNSLTEYVKVFRKRIPEDVCDSFIKYANDRSERWNRAKTVSGVDERRVCDTFDIKTDDVIDNEIYHYVQSAGAEYSRIFPYFEAAKDYGYSILRYEAGGKYDWHIDQCEEFNRQVTIILNLNDDYEGGKLSYIKDHNMIAMGKGDIVIFPSNFMYPHRINPVTSGTRYSIISWLV